MGEATTKVRPLMGAVLEDGRWVMKEIDAHYKALQGQVGGLIEFIPLMVEGADQMLSVFGNEESRLMGMEPTAHRMWNDGTVADVIVGPLVALGGPDMDGECQALTPEGFEILQRGLVPLPTAVGPTKHDHVVEIFIASW